ncbi:(2Fe-2S)-binding protein [Litchfieldia alkalitelluris]|uniref:(2Fe-2S)-binding protein n=1 Tax=Litchfieldia alkalitelluris TaxID=304268 RepID=UPI000997DA30|nr:IucA/IucC family C-terminal-domain containing protein [Litchfieldia alkalitelluris]
MKMNLLKEEIDQLKQYRLGEASLNMDSIVQLEDLLIKENLVAFLTDIKESINAPDLLVAGSMFAKRYGFFAVLSLYSMTILNKRLNTSINNVLLDVNQKGDIWLPTFIFEDTAVESTDEQRIAWRDETIHGIFNEHIDVVVKQLASVSNLSKQTLWENIAIYIFWFYERLLEENGDFDEVTKARIQDDFSYVVTEAKSDLFGAYRKNPLQKFYHKKVKLEVTDQEIRVRSTCCLYYKTNAEQTKCTTCPLQFKKAAI